jgi:hypothetical protein
MIPASVIMASMNTTMEGDLTADSSQAVFLQMPFVRPAVARSLATPVAGMLESVDGVNAKA